MLALGESWKSVADKMSITIHGVNFHVRNITRKTLCPSCFSAYAKISAL